MRKRFTGLTVAFALLAAPAAWAQPAEVAAVPAGQVPAQAGGRGGTQPATGGSGQGSAQGGTVVRSPAPFVVAPKAAVDPKLGPQAFSVVLVVGEMGNAQAVDNVPPAARKALNDMKDFLPYKSYRLLDTQWTLCCGREPIYSRLRGLDDQEYELHLQASVLQTSATTASVNVQTFMLSEARTSTTAQAELLRRQIEERRKLSTRAPDEETRALEAELTASRRSANRTVMNTSFRMDVGETVVVGTSRIHGDKALIALLTAVPPKGATAR